MHPIDVSVTSAMSAHTQHVHILCKLGGRNQKTLFNVHFLCIKKGLMSLPTLQIDITIGRGHQLIVSFL